MVGRIPVMDVMPVVDLGRLPGQGDRRRGPPVSATVFREGHDQLGAEVVLVAPDGTACPPARMTARDAPDRYTAWVTPGSEGAWTFEVHAWSDPIATWEHDAGLKIPAGVDVELMFTEGGLLLDEVAADPTLDKRERQVVAGAASAARDSSSARTRRDSRRCRRRSWSTCSRPTRSAGCSPSRAPTRCTPTGTRALFGSWYEFFPRSEGATYDEATGATVSGTFRTAAERLEAVSRRWASTSSTCRRSTRSAR